MIQPVLAMVDPPVILAILAAFALLFGAEKLPKLARSAARAKREFLIGQIEAEEVTRRH